VSEAPETGVLIDHLFRHQAGRITARLTRLMGAAHVALAEEAVQEAMVRALRTWPFQGTPDKPAGWLFRVAHNFAIDAVRRDSAFDERSDAIVAEIARSAAAVPGDPDLEEQLRDDELRMIFMCCHPALARDASVALSLKTVGGFGVREIARAFLSDEAAIAQRLVRAKRLIRDRRLSLDLPSGRELTGRLDAVLDVLYFMFNEGYASQAGEDLIRQDLCLEALRLARLVASASIATPRAHALAALIALQAARLPARMDEAGEIVLLEDQDRSRWDQRLIAIGFQHFDQSISGRDVSEYHAQAAIAATYARALDPDSVHWPLILELYDQLLAINPSPVVALNRAVVVAKVRGPAAGLAEIAPLERDPKLRDYRWLLTVRGQLLLDAGRPVDAIAAFREALTRACSEPERRFLQRKLDAAVAITESARPAAGGSAG
jgi:RNA polymerase sigma-70 factor, ECF subfamily